MSASDLPRLIHVAALVGLLDDALGHEDMRELADDGLRTDLRALRARVESELEARAGSVTDD